VNNVSVSDVDRLLEAAVPHFAARLAGVCRNPAFFLMAYSPTDTGSIRKYAAVRSSFLEQHAEKALFELAFAPEEVGIVGLPQSRQSVEIRCIAVDSRAVERILDGMKRRLWTVRTTEDGHGVMSARAPSEVLNSLTGDLAGKPRKPVLDGGKSLAPYRLRGSGLFVCQPQRKDKQVVTHSFDHGGGHFYRYRVCPTKLVTWGGRLAGIAEYLSSLFTDCPNHFFMEGPRISAQKWACLPSPLAEAYAELSTVAHSALGNRRYKSAHDEVEVALLENDASTLATEVPVWLEPAELGVYASAFLPPGCLTGHIDIVRVKSDMIEVWDYKPDTQSTETVGPQVALYAVALSIRTGIALRNFLCGYFDASSSFCFLPAESRWRDR
jgi:hypothetical protein